MWQQLETYSFRSTDPLIVLLHSGGGIVVNNKLDFFLRLWVPGPALWSHPS